MTSKSISFPLKFGPNRVWRTYRGGAVLDRMEGNPLPVDGYFPEDWIASTTRARNPQPTSPDEGLSNCIVEGERRLFAELLQANAETLLGAAHVRAFGADPRILVKYLDAAERLHIQVHPTAAFSRKFLNSAHGKAEAYYILSVRPEADPHVLIGFQRPPARAELRHWLLCQNLDALRASFDPIPVKPGDCLHIPGGVPHAIGAGICMVELMEPSDWVVRCEFEHNGYTLPEAARYLNGDPELSLACFDLAPRSLEEVRGTLFVQPRDVVRIGPSARLETLIDQRQTTAFRMRRVSMEGAQTCDLPGGEAFVGLIIEGSVRIADRECPQGSRLFFPASVDSWRLQSGSAGCLMLQCLPPAVS